MKEIKIPDMKKIIKPTWAHKPGYWVGTKGWGKQKIAEQATTPEDAKILQKLGMKKGDKVLAIAGYYGDWASAIAVAGAGVDYSDISHSIVNYAKKKRKSRFKKYICSNYELIPKEPKQYDWTFTFEACGGGQGLAIAYIRALMNNKGGILVLFWNEKRKVSMGSKPKRYPKIVKNIAEAYGGKYKIKKINIRGHKRGKPISILTHIVYTILSNDMARKKAELDLKILEHIKNKRIINLEKDSKKLKLSKEELEDSIIRLNKITKAMSRKFTKKIGVFKK